MPLSVCTFTALFSLCLLCNKAALSAQLVYHNINSDCEQLSINKTYIYIGCMTEVINISSF